MHRLSQKLVQHCLHEANLAAGSFGTGAPEISYLDGIGAMRDTHGSEEVIAEAGTRGLGNSGSKHLHLFLF